MYLIALVKSCDFTFSPALFARSFRPLITFSPADLEFQHSHFYFNFIENKFYLNYIENDYKKYHRIIENEVKSQDLTRAIRYMSAR